MTEPSHPPRDPAAGDPPEDPPAPETPVEATAGAAAPSDASPDTSLSAEAVSDAVAAEAPPSDTPAPAPAAPPPPRDLTVTTTIIAFVAGCLVVVAGYVAINGGMLRAAASAKAYEATRMSVSRGLGRIDGNVLAAHGVGGDVLIVAIATDFRARDLETIAWDVTGVPANAEVRLLFNSDYTPRRVHNRPLVVEDNRVLPLALAGDRDWLGKITGLALAVRAPGATVRIRSVTAKPLSLTQLVSDRAGEWFRDEPWTGTSINNVTGGSGSQSLPLPVPLTIAALVAFALVVAARRLFPGRYRRGVAAIGALVFVIAWLALDLRWTANLARQVVATIERYGGKDALERALAAEDGELVAFVDKAKALLPEGSAARRRPRPGALLPRPRRLAPAAASGRVGTGPRRRARSRACCAGRLRPRVASARHPIRCGERPRALRQWRRAERRRRCFSSSAARRSSPSDDGDVALVLALARAGPRRHRPARRLRADRATRSRARPRSVDARRRLGDRRARADRDHACGKSRRRSVRCHFRSRCPRSRSSPRSRGSRDDAAYPLTGWRARPCIRFWLARWLARHGSRGSRCWRGSPCAPRCFSSRPRFGRFTRGTRGPRGRRRRKAYFAMHAIVPFVDLATWTTATTPVWFDAQPAQPATLPLLQAWIVTAIGAWEDTSVALPWLLFFVALVLVVYGEVRRRGAPPMHALVAAWLVATLPLLGMQVALAGYADLPLAAAFALGSLAGVRAVRTRAPIDVVATVAALASLALYKSSGWVWVVVALPGLAAAALGRPWHRRIGVLLVVVAVAIVGVAARFPKARARTGIVRARAGVGVFAVDGVLLANWHLVALGLVGTILLRRRRVLDADVTPLTLILAAGAVWIAMLVAFPAFRGWGADYLGLNRAVLVLVPFAIAWMAIAMLDAPVAPAEIGPIEPAVRARGAARRAGGRSAPDRCWRFPTSRWSAPTRSITRSPRARCARCCERIRFGRALFLSDPSERPA